ncbi:MAG: ketoacyl-ACP synthase III [Bernardetiaceae bacterium]|nr:ketoacyl-ACP synthase III [Bernardetiaceae bacterium]
MQKITAAIRGVHGYVPDHILTNKDFEKMMETSDEWIRSRTGISERHILKGEGKGASVMGIEAVKGLLEKTNTNPEDIEMLICSTATPDMMFPATGNIIAHKTGLKNAYSFDMMAACSGFLYAIVTASKFIETGLHKKVIVVGADKMSSIVDYTDRKTAVLFGDGAGAVLLEANTDGYGIIDASLHTDGSGAEHLYMKSGGSRYPPSEETVRNKEHFIMQDGPKVFKSAVKHMAEVSESVMLRNKLAPEDVAYLVPHQANLRIIDATAQRMGIGTDKVLINIDRYGNTTTATIPLCLWDNENIIKKDDNLILAAFGGGFTWGAAYIKWGF